MTRTLAAAIAVSMFVGGVAQASPAPAPSVERPSVRAPIERAKLCRALPDATPIRLRFHAAPVVDVAQFFSCVTGRLIVAEIDLDKFSLDLHSPTPVPLAEARLLWLKALRKVGLDLFERDGHWVIERFFV